MRAKRATLLAAMFVALVATIPQAQTRSAKTLDIYVVDVEGGNATLFVSPSGESLLMDTGNGGAAAARDVDRMMAAINDAGVKQIDHLITTHWHGDHYGGMQELAKRIPIRHYIDHGPSVEKGANIVEFIEKTYPSIRGSAKHTVAKPGDKIGFAGVELRVVTSAGEAIKSPLPGAGQANPYCAEFKAQEEDRTDNAQSVGIHLGFGKFRAVHLGDLTVNKEFNLMCPANRLGVVDVFFVSHHGLAVSNDKVLAHALRPRVAVMNNGIRKGGPPATMTTLHSIPGLQDIWQLHFSLLSGQEYTVPGIFIANMVDEQPAAMPIAPQAPAASGAKLPPPPVHNGQAHWIKVTANHDGSFAVTNSRNGFTKSY